MDIKAVYNHPSDPDSRPTSPSAHADVSNPTGDPYTREQDTPILNSSWPPTKRANDGARMRKQHPFRYRYKAPPEHHKQSTKIFKRVLKRWKTKQRKTIFHNNRSYTSEVSSRITPGAPSLKTDDPIVAFEGRNSSSKNKGDSR